MSFGVEPQAFMRPGIIELRWGDPDPRLIPVESIAEAARRVFADVGAAALNYGANEGPSALRAALAERIALRERRPLSLDQIAATNGNMPALHQLTALLVRPGDVVFVEDPGFSIALRLFGDMGLELVGVPFDEGGLDVEALAEAIVAVRRGGRTPRLLYTVATFHNPTGLSLADERRRRLLEVAAGAGLLVVEDDVYRELAYGVEAPPSLWSLAAGVEGAAALVVRLGSFSKSLSPGLRCGFVTGPAAVVERFTQSGLLDGGGCLSQFTSCVVAETIRSGVYDENVAHLQRAYGARRDALVEGLRRALPASCGVTEPQGGFFLWVTLPEGTHAADLLPLAEANGVSFFGGARFSLHGDDRGMRLGFSMFEPAELAAGAERLGRAVRELLHSRVPGAPVAVRAWSVLLRHAGGSGRGAGVTTRADGAYASWTDRFERPSQKPLMTVTDAVDPPAPSVDEQRREVLRRGVSVVGSGGFVEPDQRVDVAGVEGVRHPAVEVRRPRRRRSVHAEVAQVGQTVREESAAEDEHALVAQWRKPPPRPAGAAGRGSASTSAAQARRPRDT